MPNSHEKAILAQLRKEGYQPLKPRALARKLKVPTAEYPAFRETLRAMIRKGQVEVGKQNTVRLASLHRQVIGVFRSIRGGSGFVRPKPGQGVPVGEVFVKVHNTHDAASGDLVQVAILHLPRAAGKAPEGKVLEVIERATDRFVGTYHTSEGEGFVRVDGSIFREPIYVGDAGAKGARDGDKVVFEMLRFPSAEYDGEGVLTEVLGPRGAPGVDLLTIVREFHLPDEFSEAAHAEARRAAERFEPVTITPDRLDLVKKTIVTIDPIDARDFDDAISLERDRRGFYTLGVHIADVSTFVSADGELDREARRRGTSVYLPGKVIPMLPEILSNGLASLQQGRVRLTKSVLIEFDPQGRATDVQLANSAIEVTRRLTYETVQDYFEHPDRYQGRLSAKVRALLDRMRELAGILRARRRARGFLELAMPEPVLEYDDDGRVTGAHYRLDDESHELIEEFMLTANEAVAAKLRDAKIPFLRRVHPLPDPLKLKAFAEFAESLGIRIDDFQSRFELQRVLREVHKKPTQHAVHYALLRSLKQAVYSPDEEGHYAVASDCYCHFTSPIRRYPDLSVHRLLDHWLRTGKAHVDPAGLIPLGEHCSFTERRAEKAERELVKIKLLEHLDQHVGEEMDAIVTGVNDYGFFAEGTTLPVEGLVHIRSLVDDFYRVDVATHSLIGAHSKRRYRLGDRVRCTIWRIDRDRRQLDLRVVETASKGRVKKNRPPTHRRRRS